MSGNKINRRDFLKIMGWSGAGAAALSGCDLPSYVTLQQGKENVVPYVVPEEYAVPGVGVCSACAASVERRRRPYKSTSNANWALRV